MENIIKNTYTHIPTHSTRAREVYNDPKALRKRLRASASGKLKRLLRKCHVAGYGMDGRTYGEALNRIAEMETEEQYKDFCKDTEYLRRQLSEMIKNKIEQSLYFFKSTKPLINEASRI